MTFLARPVERLINWGQPVSHGLLAAWRFDEQGGLSLLDSTGNGRHFTMNSFDGDTGRIYSEYGKAVQTIKANGTTATLSNTGWFDVPQHSFFMLFKPTTTARVPLIAGCSTASRGRFYLRQEESGGVPSLSASYSSSEDYIPGGTLPMPVGEWSLIGQTFDGVTATAWSRGKRFSVTASIGDSGGGSMALFGAFGDFVTCECAAAYAYGRSLTAQDVQALTADPFLPWRPTDDWIYRAAPTFSPANYYYRTMLAGSHR